MNCSACGAANPAGMKFCGQCGASLRKLCLQCGFANTGKSTACQECGTELPSDGENGTGREDSGGLERRHLTVVFCDLADSVELADKLDPEDYMGVVRDYQTICCRVVDRWGGHVAQFLGDGLLVYFGYPWAEEDDAQRAVHCGLGILDALERVNRRFERQGRFTLSVRIGIHTGDVVMGPVGGEHHREHLATGQAPYVAARLKAMAEADMVVLSADTFRVVRGFFEYEPLGTRELQGFSQPLGVYRALGKTGVTSRFGLALARGLTPLVGRERERDLLLAAFQRCLAGHSEVVLLSGEAGMGKSRLVEVVREHAVAQGHGWWMTYCARSHRNSAFHPLVELLRERIAWRPQDSDERHRNKLQSTLESYGLDARECLPLLSSFLSIAQDPNHSPLQLSPQRQKERTLEVLATLVAREAEERPLVLAVEDLHWGDPSSLEFLKLLAERPLKARVLLLVTARPGFQPGWREGPGLTRVELERLDDRAVREMIRHLAGDRSLQPEILEQVVARTDGVPIFVEELTRMILESNELEGLQANAQPVGQTLPLSIPATLMDSLRARLDRLAGVKETAQKCAVLGRRFGYGLLASCFGDPADTLERHLARLVKSKILHQTGTPPTSTYAFQHSLMQEAAYDSILQKLRRGYHRRVADTLVEKFPDVVQTSPEELAAHLTAANLTESAVDYWQEAGLRALERSANTEASGHFRTALKLLRSLPPSEAQRHQEMVLSLQLGQALIPILGFAAREVQRRFEYALGLLEDIDAPQLDSVLWGLWSFYSSRAENQRALELAHRLLQLAESQASTTVLMEGHFTVGVTQLARGELLAARYHLERGIATEEPQTEVESLLLSPSVNTRSYLALTLWLLGYPDQALQHSARAVGLARRIGEPFGLAAALVNAAGVHWFRHELAGVEKCAREARELSEAKGLFTEQSARQWLDWVACMRQDPCQSASAPGEERIREMLARLDEVRGSGARFSQPLRLCIAIEILLRAGLVGKAQELLEEATSLVAETGERVWDPELYRVQGEVELVRPLADCSTRERQAEASFRRAAESARGQGSKSLELRAVLCLASLWHRQGRDREARDSLEDVYTRFSEGLDTGGLVRARALLAQLTRSRSA